MLLGHGDRDSICIVPTEGALWGCETWEPRELGCSGCSVAEEVRDAREELGLRGLGRRCGQERGGGSSSRSVPLERDTRRERARRLSQKGHPEHAVRGASGKRWKRHRSGIQRLWWLQGRLLQRGRLLQWQRLLQRLLQWLLQWLLQRLLEWL